MNAMAEPSETAAFARPMRLSKYSGRMASVATNRNPFPMPVSTPNVKIHSRCDCTRRESVGVWRRATKLT